MPTLPNNMCSFAALMAAIPVKKLTPRFAPVLLILARVSQVVGGSGRRHDNRRARGPEDSTQTTPLTWQAIDKVRG